MSSVHSTISLPAELAILVCCARTETAVDTARLAALLAGPVDWSRLIELASRHAMAPLVAWHLRSDERVPTDVREKLEERFRSSAQYSMMMAGELRALLAIFAREGIAVLPYKGPVAASALYGNLALRPFGDLDLLLGEQDVRRCAVLLEERGYRSPIPLAEALRPGPLPAEGQLLFERADRRLVVELHWAVTQEYFAAGFDWEDLWQHRGAAEVAGEKVPTLSPEDTFLVLAVHHTKHRWERLIWIADIAQLVRVHEKLDWERVLERARELGVERMALLAIHLAGDLLDAPVPEAARRRIEREPEVARLAAEAVAELVRREGRLSDIDERAAFHLRSWESPLRRGRYWLVRVFVPTLEDRGAILLPRPLYFLYYLLRPLRLLLKHGRGLPGRGGG